MNTNIDITTATALELTTRNAYAVVDGRRWQTTRRVTDNLPESRTTNGPKRPDELTDHQRHIIAESFRRFPAIDVTPPPMAETEAHVKISVTLPASQVQALKKEAAKTGEKLSRVVSRHLHLD